MIHKLWTFLFVVGILYSLFNGRVDVVNQAVLQGASAAVTLVMGLAGILIFWTGILEVANRAKMLDFLGVLLAPIMKILYPKLPRQHASLKYLTTNMLSNFLGLSSVATGSGIKAIAALQATNPKKDRPTVEMITLMVINTAGFALLPTTVITLRQTFHAMNPTDVFTPIILTTFFSTVIGLIAHAIVSRLRKVHSSGGGGS